MAPVGGAGPGGGGAGPGGGGAALLATVGLASSRRLGWRLQPETKFFLGKSFAKFGSDAKMW